MHRAYAAAATVTVTLLLAGCTATGATEAADVTPAPSATPTAQATTAADPAVAEEADSSEEIQALYDANMALLQPPITVISDEVKRVGTAMNEIEDLDGEAYFEAAAEIEELDYDAVAQAGRELEAALEEAWAVENDVLAAMGPEVMAEGLTEWGFHYSSALNEMWTLSDQAKVVEEEITYVAMLRTFATLYDHLAAMEEIEAIGDPFSA